MYTLERGADMKASILDLRRKMKDVLDALDHNENVTITHRGKVKGVLYPAAKVEKNVSVSELPAFGMWKNDKTSVKEKMKQLRKPRYDDI